MEVGVAAVMPSDGMGGAVGKFSKLVHCIGEASSPDDSSSSCQVGGWRSQYAYHFCDGYKTLSGHISLTKMLHNENTSAIERGAAPQLKSDEFLLWIIFVSEICGRSKFCTHHKSDTHIGSATPLGCVMGPKLCVNAGGVVSCVGPRLHDDQGRAAREGSGHRHPHESRSSRECHPRTPRCVSRV